MNKALILILVLCGSIGAADRKAAPLPPQPDYVHSTYGPKAVISAAGHAVYGQITDRPKAWGQGVGGFGARAASSFGTHIVNNTITFPIAKMLHEDLRYHRSTDTGFGPRLRHALVSTVWTPKTNSGKKTVAVGRISGAFGSGLISRIWQPAALRTVGGGLASGGVSLGAQAGVNVAREFWPRGGGKKVAPLPPR